MTEGQYSLVRLELARLVSSLLYGTRAMLVFNLLAFKNKKYTAKNQSERLDLPCHIINVLNASIFILIIVFFKFIFSHLWTLVGKWFLEETRYLKR